MVLNYYPHAYIVTTGGEVVADLGTYIISIQGYSGTTYNGRDEAAWLSMLQNGLDNYSMFGGSVIAPDSFSNDLAFFLERYPVIDPLYLGNITDSTLRIKLVFTDNGDYLLSNSGLSSSEAGIVFKGYDADGNQPVGGFSMYVPGMLNRLDDPAYVGNQPQFRMIDANKITSEGFITEQGNITDYYVLAPKTTVFRYIYSRSDNIYFYRFLNRHEPNNPPTKPDPYEPGGTSGTGGGTGNFDLSSDAVDFPGLPTLSAVDTGLVTIYTPTLAQMRSLANYMWNADVQTVDWWKKLVANPLDLVLGLSIVPVTVPAGATQNIKVGFIDTGVSMTKAASQFVEVDCGSLNVTEFFGSALDYSPFRKTSIYLPFIGTRTLSTDDIMGKTVQVKYHIDILSGALTAMIKAGDAVLYQYSGSCSISLPLTGQTFTDMITSTIQLAAGIAGTVAGGGAVAGPSLASTANNVMGMKPHIERAGGVSGPAGQLGIMRPYLIGEIPRQSVPANYNQFAGYPCNIKAVLGDLTGFTQVETVYLSDIAATDAELEEIETLLKEGVFINAA